MMETPSISASNYANSTYAGSQMMGNAAFISNSTSTSSLLAQQNLTPRWDTVAEAREAAAQEHRQEKVRRAIVRHSTLQQEKEEPMPSRRIVQVYIADPDDAVPLADSILYTSDQKMTDLNDQELFFEIDIKGVLEAHNAKRTKIVDKEVKDRTEYLEPAKVRDLKMVVVTVASF